MTVSGSENNGTSQPIPSSAEIRTLIDDAQKAVRDELIKKFAGWVVAGLVGLLGLAVVGGWFILKPILTKEVGGVPEGAVVAFDRADLTQDDCPDGWRPYKLARARTIVGAGALTPDLLKMATDEHGRPLVGYVLRQHGGEQVHELRLEEIPSHVHTFVDHQFVVTTPAPRDSFGGLREPAGGGAGQAQNTTNPVGGNDRRETVPHNTMPPFIALYYCKKDK